MRKELPVLRQAKEQPKRLDVVLEIGHKMINLESES